MTTTTHTETQTRAVAKELTDFIAFCDTDDKELGEHITACLTKTRASGSFEGLANQLLVQGARRELVRSLRDWLREPFTAEDIDSLVAFLEHTINRPVTGITGMTPGALAERQSHVHYAITLLARVRKALDGA